MTKRAPELKDGATLAEYTAWQMSNVSEKTFQSTVVHLARALGWREFHTLHSMGSAKGFPDLVLMRPPRMLFWELKSARGKATPEQEAWIAGLAMCGMDAAFLWPRDWERIEKELR